MIEARFLREARLGSPIPAAWLEDLRRQAETEVWRHYFLWEAFQLLELLEGKPVSGMRILEPGCGSGVVASLLALMGADVTLLDNDRTALDVARQHARRLGVEARLRFWEADFFEAPVPEQPYDLVWNDGVIEHMDQPTEFVRAMARMSRAGGQVCVAVPNRWTLHTWVVRPWMRWCGTFDADRWGREKSYTERELRGILEAAGLRRVRTSTHHLRRALLDDLQVVRIANRLAKPVANLLTNAMDALEANSRGLSRLGFMVAGIGQTEPPASLDGR